MKRIIAACAFGALAAFPAYGGDAWCGDDAVGMWDVDIARLGAYEVVGVREVRKPPARSARLRTQRVRRVFLNSYHELGSACHEAWRIGEAGGPSGICVPRAHRYIPGLSSFKEHPSLLPILAPHGAKKAGEFFREMEREYGGDPGGSQ